ncbi:MAG: hypothetical protein ACLSFR_05270 [Alphaproteobacteria bacterium]
MVAFSKYLQYFLPKKVAVHMGIVPPIAQSENNFILKAKLSLAGLNAL